MALLSQFSMFEKAGNIFLYHFDKIKMIFIIQVRKFNQEQKDITSKSYCFEVKSDEHSLKMESNLAYHSQFSMFDSGRNISLHHIDDIRDGVYCSCKKIQPGTNGMTSNIHVVGTPVYPNLENCIFQYQKALE